jgi:Raf kinase inhibitor-like YbhB/YbcL family protein
MRLVELTTQLGDGFTQELQLGAFFVAQLDAPIPRLIGLSHGRCFAFRRPAPARRAPVYGLRPEDQATDQARMTGVALTGDDATPSSREDHRPPPHTLAPIVATARGRGDSIILSWVVDFALQSSAFEHGGPIPRQHSCEGEDLSPPLSWSGVPEGTLALALVVDDPDAPAGTFTHWLGWALDADAGGLGEGEAAPVEGRNDFGTSGYRGPCPPHGHGRHRYSFRLYALNPDPALPSGAGKRELERALEGHTLAAAELIGTYER